MDTGERQYFRYTFITILFHTRLEMDHLSDLVRHKTIVPMEVTREQSISNSRIATQLMESAERKTVIQMGL